MPKPLVATSHYDTDLLASAATGDLPGVMAALDAGANINAQSDTGWTAALEAIKFDSAMLELLICRGIDLDLASDRGYTPLMRAAGTGREQAVRLLLAHGANPAARDCNQKTAYLLSMETQEYEASMLVGDAHSDKIIRDRGARRRADGFELRRISVGDRMMVDMTRSTVGGSVTRLYLVFDDESRVDGVRLLEELVLEVPLQFAGRHVRAVGVPFEQF